MKYAVFSIALLISVSVFAQNSPKISDLQKERRAALKEIEETNRLLNENKTSFNNALSQLNLIKRKVSSRRKIISALNTEIDTLNYSIAQKEKQLNILEKNLNIKKADYAATINKLYQRKNNHDFLLFILSAKDFTQSYHRMRYLKDFSTWRKKQGEEIKSTQQSIRAEKDLINQQLAAKQSLLDERKSEQNKLSQEEQSQQKTVKTLETNNKKLQQTLALKKKQADALNKQIEKIIAQETAKAEKEAKKEGAEKRVTSEKGGYAMTPAELTLSTNMANNKGRLPYPLKGSYMIVSHFGINQHKELSRVSINNNGIDIETTPGNDALCVFDGVVSTIFTLPGYNFSIIVRHGNYMTLYANIASVYVKQGDKVKTGQTLGKIYTDSENGNSTLLHFELWKDRTKLNPESWLRK